MSSKKKKMLTVSIVAILLCTLSTAAFLTSGEVSDNVVTFGNLRLKLINNTIDDNGDEVAVNQLEEKLTGNSVSRIIKVQNVCKNPMYVRVKIEFEGEDKNGEFSTKEYVSFESSKSSWTNKDGWFYYNKILKPDQMTSDLFRELRFDLDKLMTDHSGGTLQLKVSAQAVQSENNGSSALSANGWPQEAGK